MACPTTTTNKSIWPIATSTKFSNKSVNHIVETGPIHKNIKYHVYLIKNKALHSKKKKEKEIEKRITL
jgi:hypothetical protein